MFNFINFLLYSYFNLEVYYIIINIYNVEVLNNKQVNSVGYLTGHFLEEMEVYFIRSLVYIPL